MAQSKQVKAEAYRYGWDGDRSVTIYQEITEGPAVLVGKHLTLRLTFEEVNDLRQYMAEAVKQLEQAAVNARNAE